MNNRTKQIMTRTLVFDTETTGLIPNAVRSYHEMDDPTLLEECPHITQLSYVVYDTDTENVKLANYYIQSSENVQITHEASNITKIYKTTADAIHMGVENLDLQEITILEKLKYHSTNIFF